MGRKGERGRGGRSSNVGKMSREEERGGRREEEEGEEKWRKRRELACKGLSEEQREK